MIDNFDSDILLSVNGHSPATDRLAGLLGWLGMIGAVGLLGLAILMAHG
jgi:hypothetical protein